MDYCLGKTPDKNLGGPNEFEIRVGFLPFSQGSIISFPDISKDCSLVQCLIVSRAETSKKKFFGRNDLFYFNVVERPLKLIYSISLLIHAVCL